MLYHWTTEEKAQKILKSGKLAARRWQHFLEHEQRFINGSSWSPDPLKWKSTHTVCFIIDESKLQNKIHYINGNRTYLLTMGLKKKDFDPTAYQFESTDVDEAFVEGAINNINDCLISVNFSNQKSKLNL